MNELRQQIRDFLDEQLPHGWRGVGTLDPGAEASFVDVWRQTLHAHRWLAPCWPVEFGGRGLDPAAQPIIDEEFARMAAPTGGPNDSQGIQMLGATLLELGETALCDEFLPGTLDGSIRWSEGFSEPDAGSDLAAVRTTVTAHGDELSINGQKVWTSNADTSNWMFLLARSNTEVAKHAGLSFVLVDLRQPGVEIRPIRQISGGTEFCEVYFADVIAQRRHVVGGLDNGWKVALSLLANERSGISSPRPVSFAAEFQRLLNLAQMSGRAHEPVVRQRLASTYTSMRLLAWLSTRASVDPTTNTAMAPVLKTQWTEHHQSSALLGVDLLGAQALTPTGRPPSQVFGADDMGARPDDSMSWVATMLNARSASIYAGTNEIQRNIIAEQLLGLPREPRPAVSPPITPTRSNR
jgi:alkylation response protein AidB-like acyl-CoA dehydrogenase